MHRLYIPWLALSLTLLTLVLPLKGRAQGIDYSAYTIVSYPLGGFVNGWLGYNWFTWGEKKDGDFHYGYLRPHVRLLTNGSNHRAETRIDYYPIAFLGVTLGHVFSYRGRNIGELDCGISVSCKGVLWRNFVELKGKAGYNGFYGTLGVRLDHLIPDDELNAFGDDASQLVGHSNSDQLFHTDLNLGYKIDPDWSAGITGQYRRMIRTKETSNQFGMVARYKFWENWAATLQIQFPERTHQARHFSTGLQIDWLGRPSLAL